MEITVTISLIKQMIQVINKELFNNQLNLNVPILLSNSKKSLAQVNFQIRQGQDITLTAIRVSKHIIFTEELLKNTLAHELIHVYEIQILNRKPGHSYAFKNKMDELNYNHPSYKISLKEVAQVKKSSEKSLAYILSEDRTKMVITSLKSVTSFLISSSLRSSFKNYKVGEISSLKASNYSVQRKYRGWYTVDEKKLKSLGI